MPNTREKLIELIERAKHSWSLSTMIPLACTFGSWIADHLIANGVTVQNWIPVTERLPDKTGLVLGWDIGFGVLLVYYEVGAIRSGWQSITHWMHLPEPPKGE